MSERKSKKKPGSRNGGNAGNGGGSAAGAGGPMDVALLQQIVKLMAANDLNTVDLRDGGRRVVLKRGAQVVAMTTGMTAPPQAHAPVTHPSATPALQQPAASDDDTKGLIPTKSPMVGTFYAASKPGEKPLVSVGTPVNEDTDVCIIEAMKTFNVHKAGVNGTIARVLVQDGQTVQFDQPLFLVNP
jgi:acetyl-CoA carboxylase biotin carboxyl carrier protein